MSASRGALGARLFCLVVAGSAVVAGCTVNGPEATPPAENPPSETGSARPAELGLDGQSGSDLCSLLSPQQQSQLQIHDGKPAPTDSPEDPPGCVWIESSDMLYTVGLRAVPEEVTEAAGEESSGTAKSLSVVGGFPAEQRQVPGAESLGCTVFVGVAEKWTLAANIGNPPKDMTDQQMCVKAKTAAELAVTTLQGQG